MAKDRNRGAAGKKLTARESVLLVVLLMALAIYAFANFFLLPTFDEIAALQVENEGLQGEYNTRRSFILQKEKFMEDIEENERVLEGYKSQYFQTTNQEHFIKVLELEFLRDEDLEVDSVSFNQVQPYTEFTGTEAGASYIASTMVTFPFTGTYESFMNLMARLESYDHLIRVNSLSISEFTNTTSVAEVTSTEELYQGNIHVEFFTVDQDYVYPWFVRLPNYDRASTYTSALFAYRQGWLVNPVTSPGGSTSGDQNNGTSQDPDGEFVGTPPENNPGGETGENPIVGEENPITGDGDQDLYTYVVQPGDTLWEISNRFYGTGSYVERIMELNNITDPTSLESGTTIQLPSPMK